MATGEGRRVKAVFSLVRRSPPAERAQRLSELCAGDENLRAEVEELLKFDEARGLEEPLSIKRHADRDSDPLDLAGKQVGGFTFTRMIGRGGMGVVWEAEQERPRRSVAVKLMRHGAASPDAQRRFEHEIEVSGGLKHASIAQVYSAGSFEHSGESIPFFLMELIEGARPLGDYVRETKQGLRERLELLRQVCAAVHYAHQRGVIHRDLKPSNILVGADGVPKVIDFGVARAVDVDATLTRKGELIGTLAYMSPEQCAADPGDVDVRSDIYSLGVVLFELVCDRLPYDIHGKSLASAMLTIREREPDDPVRFAPRLSPELRAVLLKSLSKDRDLRYASAAELEADIRRWLRGEPVEARPPSRWRRLTGWIGRHPVLVTAVACLLVILVSALSMVVTREFLAVQPVGLDLDPSYKRASLRSRAGLELRSWDAGEGEIAFGAFVERPPELGGGGVVALAYSAGTPLTIPFASEFCLFDASEPDIPFWSSAEYPLVSPDEGPSQANGRYRVAVCVSADVFASSPGIEFIVLHRNVLHDATAIRIYDCLGGLHFEAWHFGGLHDVHWVPSSRLVVATGVNSERRWDELGHPMTESAALYPAIALALEPWEDHLASRSFLAFAGEVRDTAVHWYKWLGPPEELAPLQSVIGGVRAPDGNWSSKEFFQLDFVTDWTSAMAPQPRLSFVVDSTGIEVERFAHDSYKRWELEGTLPPVSVYRLMDYQELFAGR